MWILDSYYKGCVELWSQKEGSAGPVPPILPYSACHLKILYAHWEMIEGLESRYRVEDCPFNTIFGSFQASTDLL